MSEGVAIDMGTPGATPVDSNGHALAPRLRFTVEADGLDIVRAAKGFSAMGYQDIADRICQTAGIKPVKANIIERHPAIAGSVITLVAVGAAWGGYKLWTRWRNKRAMPAVTADGKVIPLPIRVAR